MVHDSSAKMVIATNAFVLNFFFVERYRADKIIRERQKYQKRRRNKGHEFLRDNKKYKRNGGYQKDKVFIKFRRQVIPQKAALKQSEHYVVDIP